MRLRSFPPSLGVLLTILTGAMAESSNATPLREDGHGAIGTKSVLVAISRTFVFRRVYRLLLLLRVHSATHHYGVHVAALRVVVRLGLHRGRGRIRKGLCEIAIVNGDVE